MTDNYSKNSLFYVLKWFEIKKLILIMIFYKKTIYTSQYLEVLWLQRRTLKVR